MARPASSSRGRDGRAVGQGVGGEVQHRQLPQADRMVGHDVGHRHRAELGAGPHHLGLDLGDLLGGELLVVAGAGAGVPFRHGAGEVATRLGIGGVLP